MADICIIVIDMQNDFLSDWDTDLRAVLVGNVNRLVHEARAQNIPVLWVRQEFAPDLSDAFLEIKDRNISITIQGTKGAELHSDLARDPKDEVIIKKRYSAFFQTELDAVLQKLGTRTIVLAGVNTHACIRMAAIDAYQRDLRVIIAEDCVGSRDEHHAQVSLDYMNNKIAKVRDLETVLSTLRS